MPNLNSLILTAADFKVVLNIPGVSAFPLKTVENISWNNAREDETIYAVGEEEPIGEKRNAAKYSGKISMQLGELSSILGLSGLVEGTQIANATLAITAVQGGFKRVWSGFYINTEAQDIKAKDKQTVVSLDWKALTIN